MVARGDVYWVNLDPSVGSEIRKTRPALVISPDDLNAALPRVIMAPLTSKGQRLGCRPAVHFGGKEALLLLDQLRCVEKRRLGEKMGTIPLEIWHASLLELFE
ncbi:MAG TPA: type II toxin-antitoxin system PemK/MazF family toxin [Rectinemataceae bacterium]|nr:type II toxin-antitoxin system PemK/MazF family toxin [Rectinemataceae bacterium]